MCHLSLRPPRSLSQAPPVLEAALASEVLMLRSWRGCGGVWEGLWNGVGNWPGPVLGWVELSGGPEKGPAPKIDAGRAGQ